MSVNLSALAGAGQQFFDNNGVILSGGKLYSYAAGTTTPQAAYTSASGSTPHTNPIILNSAGRVATGEIWLTAGENYKFSLFTSADVLIATWDNITGINGTGITSNAAGVIYDPAGTGAVATNVQAKLRESTNAVNDFGADNTGTTNATTALKAFFDYCISSGKPGHIPAGTYLVTPGVLVFDSVTTDKNWPYITTEGFRSVIFRAADNTAAAIIKITNGTPISTAGKFWYGGSLGGIRFEPHTSSTGLKQHGLQLTGIWGCTFGYFLGVGLAGHTVHIPSSRYLGNNPDPSAVLLNSFEGIESNFSDGMALYNKNGVGFVSNNINLIRAINTTGGWYGIGVANYVSQVSMGDCFGWAIHDGSGDLLGTNPLTTTNGSKVVIVSETNHGWATGDIITFAGQSGALNGIPAVEINTSQTLTVIDDNSYSFAVATTNATSSGAGGGSTIEYRSDSLLRSTIGVAEIDTVQYGIKLNRLALFDWGQLRFNHRFQFGINTDPVYWPTVCFDIASITSHTVTQGEVKCTHRVESGTGIFLGANPLSVTATSTTVTVTHTSHGYSSGEVKKLIGVPSSVGGIPRDRLNGLQTITVVDPNTYTFVASTAANTTTTGGGSTVCDRIGRFVDMHTGGGISGLTIDQNVTDNAGIGITDSDLFDRTNTGSIFELSRAGRVINDSINKAFIVATGSSGTVIGSNPLALDPITTTNGSLDFSIAITAHGVIIGQVVVLSGAAAVGGLTANQLNTSFAVVSVTDANTIVLKAIGAAATSSASGGGAAVVARKDRTWIQSNGDAAINSKAAFPTVQYDKGTSTFGPHYSSTLYEYTAPWSGPYRLNAMVHITGLAAGNRVIMSFYKNMSTTPTLMLTREYRAQGANREGINLTGIAASVTKGDRICLTLTTNAAPGVIPSIGSASSDTYWTAEPI
jgi:hypothetical protein